MEKLNNVLWSVAMEYTRQMAEVMQCSHWYWIGRNEDGTGPVDTCDFDGVYFFSLEEMQVVIDNLDKWVERYGSKEGVAEEIIEWFNWWLGDPDKEPQTMDGHPLLELYENRRERYLRTRPYINLEHWLMGCPREPRKPTIDDELRLLKVQREMVKELTQRYREARTLWNVFDNLTAEIKALEQRKERQDREELERMKQSDAYKEFEQVINDFQ